MSDPGTIGWFARHEARLAWRDWLSLMTAGNRRRIGTVAVGLGVFALFLHVLAWLMLTASAGHPDPGDTGLRTTVIWVLVLAWSLMLSQAMESVTRAFYARGDLELILTSPAAATRLFAVRIAAMAATIVAMALVMAAPLINVLVWLSGSCWLGGYEVAASMALTAVAVAAVLTILLFGAIGPRRTRLASQILSAVVGAGFAIYVQFVTILSYESLPAVTVSGETVSALLLPDAGRAFQCPAPGVMGDPAVLAILLLLGVVALAAATGVVAPRFGAFALAAGEARSRPKPGERRRTRFGPASPSRALRRKEWTLLLRDPWLLSQTLMQLLYLLPAAFILWRNFHGFGMVGLLVPILIVTAGQLGGGLAWLAVSGEGAPDLITSAPVSAWRVLRAKIEAVLGVIALVFGPFAAIVAIRSPAAAVMVCVGATVAACTSAVIQYWFRFPSGRGLFRRRQTASRLATFAEALSSTGWAGTGALAVTGNWMAVVPAMIVVAIVAGAWMVSPERGPAAA